MSWQRRIRSYRDIYDYHRARTLAFAEHDFHYVYRDTRDRLERARGAPLVGARLLDIGCGQRFPATLLFTGAGNRVTGIDTELVVRAPSVVNTARILRSDGIERALKTLFRQLVFDPLYYRRLAELHGGPLPRRDLDIRQLSITAGLPFAAGEFDAIISNAVFEHVADVSAAVRAVSGLLAPGGICHIGIHLFPSLSGGHHMRWAFPDEEPPDDIPPWDHLRENRFPSHVYLNRMTERDYRQAFAAVDELEILDWLTVRTEGEGLLTPELEAELGARYTREDLLKREIVVMGRRRDGGGS